LRAQYHALKPEIDAAIDDVLESSSYILGKYVETFEAEVCRFLGVRHAVGVNSGTDALLLSLIAAGIQPGDEVITAANSFFATAEAISLVGAQPVFVDVKRDTYNLDPSLIEAAITSRTRAIIPVHLYGQPADMDEILGIANRHGLAVVEDACQAMGATYRGKRVGGLGLAGCFSFVPAKNLGGYGDGGMVTTNDDRLAAAIRVLRDHGSSRKYVHQRVGYNSRLDAIQAAVLSVKLRHLDEWNQRRRSLATLYDELLGDLDVIRPTNAGDRQHIYHLYVIRSRQRDGLMEQLKERGIDAMIHYPVAIHRQPAFQDRDYPPLPVTDEITAQILSLPMWPLMTEAQVRATVEGVRDSLVALSDAVPA
jgi:dTDP-4-amino-4,6-dideoxygalactose transaminase